MGVRTSVCPSYVCNMRANKFPANQRMHDPRTQITYKIYKAPFFSTLAPIYGYRGIGMRIDGLLLLYTYPGFALEEIVWQWYICYTVSEARRVGY